MIEAANLSARPLVQAVGRTAPVRKKGYVGLIRDCTSDLQTVPREAEAIAAKFAERETKWSELDVRFQLFAEEAGRVGVLQERLNARTKQLELAKKDFEAK